jgi:hypothetical protein
VTTQTHTADNTAETAKDQTRKLAANAQDQAAAVAGTAKEQAGAVAGEAKAQAQDLFEQATSHLSDQAGAQADRLGEGAKRLGDDLKQMANGAPNDSTARSIVLEAGERASKVADYLNRSTPNQIGRDLQDLGRRRPTVFLLGAALAGVVVGRLGVAVKNASDTPSTATTPATPAKGVSGAGELTELESAPHGAPTIQPASGPARP